MVNENPRKRWLRIWLAGMSFRQAWLRDGVGSLSRPCASALAVLFFLLAMVPGHLACQNGARQPMASGSASVTLIATLESLTVAATPMAPGIPVLGHGSVPDAGSLAITSSWAVPANLTTIRMVCLAGGGAADAIDMIRENGGKGSTVASPLQKDGPGRQPPGQDFSLNAGAESRIVYAQRAGESNRAFTRTDYLHVENKATIPPVQQPNSGRGSLSVVVQAL